MTHIPHHRPKGYTIVELMVAITLASILSLAVMSFFFSQSGSINRATSDDNTAIESNSSFEMLSRLLRHAEVNSITVSSGTLNSGASGKPEIANDETTIDFAIPSGFPIWPNLTPPYDKNWIRISWTNSASDANAYAVLIANATSKALLDSATPKVLAGSAATSSDTRIANLDLWPLQSNGAVQSSRTAPAEGGYLLRVTARSGKPLPGYVNPQFDTNDPWVNFRTYTVTGIVSPRN